jgi:hypothetical protein
MKIKFSLMLLASCFTLQANAVIAFNHGGLGCGTIVPMRESTQKPISSELADEYNVPRIGGGFFGPIFGFIPGVGLSTAVAGDVVVSAVANTISSSLKEADMAKQAETAKYKDVQAIEFKFDDGEVVNIPVYVVSGMRYKVGGRLNAMISPKYGNIALGANVFFASVPDVGDKDYKPGCRIDNVEVRRAALEDARTMVDESWIVNPSERRQLLAVAVLAPAALLDANILEAVAPK